MCSKKARRRARTHTKGWLFHLRLWMKLLVAGGGKNSAIGCLCAHYRGCTDWGWERQTLIRQGHTELNSFCGKKKLIVANLANRKKNCYSVSQGVLPWCGVQRDFNLINSPFLFAKWLSSCSGNEVFENVFGTHQHTSFRHLGRLTKTQACARTHIFFFVSCWTTFFPLLCWTEARLPAVLGNQNKHSPNSQLTARHALLLQVHLAILIWDTAERTI